MLIFTYIVFNGDIMAPSFIFCAMYTFSIGCALVNYDAWGLSVITNQLVELYLLGAIIFILIGLLCKVLFAKNYKAPSEKGLKKITIGNYVTFSLILINTVALLLWIINVYKISGGGSFSVMMESFRLKTSYGTDASMPNYLLQLSKIVTVSGYIYGFVYINNLLSGNGNKFLNLLLVNPAIYLLFSIFSSNRLNFLNFISALVIYYYLLKSVKLNMENRSIRLIIKLITLFLLVLLVFYGIRLLVGRISSENSNLIDYITMYAGGPVKLFDLYLQQPIHSNIWGKETFISVNQLLRKLGIFDIPQYLVHKEFRTYEGINLGNVYSAYRNWYADFGFKGTILLQSIFSIFFNIYYYKLRGTRYYDKHKLGVILYGYMASCIFLHPIDDEFYRYTISIGFLVYLLIFWVIYKLTIKKIKFRL